VGVASAQTWRGSVSRAVTTVKSAVAAAVAVGSHHVVCVKSCGRVLGRAMAASIAATASRASCRHFCGCSALTLVRACCGKERGACRSMGY